MTPDQMAKLHAAAFAGQGRGWSAAEISELLQDGSVFAVHNMDGFALGRVIADEAEILTIATDPGRQRQGVARKVFEAFTSEALKRGAQRVFLEVAQDNVPALALYYRAGFVQVGHRKAYYKRANGAFADAMIMQVSIDHK